MPLFLLIHSALAFIILVQMITSQRGNLIQIFPLFYSINHLSNVCHAGPSSYWLRCEEHEYWNSSDSKQQRSHCSKPRYLII